jgi:shikimate dehydrogenase
MNAQLPALFTGQFSVNGATRLYGTVGDPMRQLRLTAMMPQIFAAAGINAVWLPFEGGADLLPLLLDGLGKLRNFAGLAVTTPHEAAALRLLGRATRRAEAAGSANLVRREHGGMLVGDNVEGTGFVRGLEAQGPRLRGASVWVVGLGAVGGAIAAALCEAGVGRLLLTEIQRARMDATIDRLSRHYPDVPVAEVATPPKGIHVAINATTLGLRPEDPLSFDPLVLSPDVVVADVIMTPAETPLLHHARTHGRRIHHGRHMLDHQVPLILDWFDIDAKDLDVIALARSIGR